MSCKMDFLCFFVVLGSLFGCFPANLKFILGKEALTPLKIRHYILSIFFLLLLVVQSLEMICHSTDRYWSLKTSEKMSVIIAVVTSLIFDFYFRLYGIFCGQRLSQLIDDLRKVKEKFGEMSGAILRRSERKWFTFGAALVLAMQCVHLPLRAVDWYSNQESINYELSLYPKTPVLLCPLVILTNMAFVISRNFVVVIIVWIGLELLECYQLLNSVVHNSDRNDSVKTEEAESLEKKCSESTKSQSLLIDPSFSVARNEASEEPSDLLKKVLLEQFVELQSCFHRFNHILGSYALTALVWTVGNMLMEIKALPGKDGNSRLFGTGPQSVAYDLASIVGTLSGLGVTYLICLLGHRIEYAVRKNSEKIEFMRLLSPEVYGGNKVYECLALFKWEFTAKGLFVINLGLIPGIAGAVFSIAIFHMQLESSEREGSVGGQTSFPLQSIFTTEAP